MGKRGLSNTPPSYRKHKATGKAIVTIGGRDYYLGNYGSKASQLEYDRLVGEWLANGRRMPEESSQGFTVAELVEAYWKFALCYYVKNGKPTDELPGLKVALKFVVARYGSALANDFGPLSLEAVRDCFVEAGHSRKYCNQNTGRIKRMFKWGVSRELVDVSVHQALSTVTGLRKGKTKARESEPVLPIDDAVVDKTIQHIPNKQTADMVRIQRLTGCRPGELFMMRPRDIDKTGDGHQGVWLYVVESHKMEHKERRRVVVAGPKAQAILENYLSGDPNQPCFLRDDGRPYEGWHYIRHIQRGCNNAFPAPKCLNKQGIKVWRKSRHWAPNRLRHTASTEIRREHGLEAAQVVAGHATADVTQIYAERDLARAASIMRDIG